MALSREDPNMSERARPGDDVVRCGVAGDQPDRSGRAPARVFETTMNGFTDKGGDGVRAKTKCQNKMIGRSLGTDLVLLALAATALVAQHHQECGRGDARSRR
jgi:hypothetical protein